MQGEDELLTVHQVSAYLKKSPSTIYRLLRNGQLPGKKIGGTWRFSRQQLDAWILSGERTAASNGSGNH